MKRHIVLLVIVSYSISIGPALGRKSPPSRAQARQAEQPYQSHRPPPANSRSVAANSRFVYVLQGNELHQADAITLRWLHTVQLPTSDPDHAEDSRRKPLGQYGPWNRDLDMATSVDGVRFSRTKRFVERGGVPCIARIGKGQLMAVFQWFPLDKRERFDKIAMVISEDDGDTWTLPQTVAFDGMPDYLYRQFDPTLVVLEDGRLRLYFTSENQNTRTTVICSAISEDGSRFVFEEGMRFTVEDENIVDCAVAHIGDRWHIYCPVPRHDGNAYHAVSEDGLAFQRTNDLSVPGTGQWIGNVIVVGDKLRFYGSGRGGIWLATSKDGLQWVLSGRTGMMGGDPGVVRTASGRYLMIVTGGLRPDATPERPFVESNRMRPLQGPGQERPDQTSDSRRQAPLTDRRGVYPRQQRSERIQRSRSDSAIGLVPRERGDIAPAAIACNEASVFVLRDSVVYRFDAEQLRLLGTTRLGNRIGKGGLDNPGRRRPERFGPRTPRRRSQEPGEQAGESFGRQGTEERRVDPDERSGTDFSEQIDIRSLPDISQFAANKSDRFPVDLDDVRTGHPYLGENAVKPHTGGHPSSYPAIYAVADGYVTRIDEYFKLRAVYFPALGKSVSNYRYGVTLAIARKDNAVVNFHYSIEPMTDPDDRDFYKRFIFVSGGQRVKKGDVIARMYIPADPVKGQNTHIHFNLMDTGTRSFMTPSIFTDEIIREFHAKWEGRRALDGDVRIPPCMGYRISAKENPLLWCRG